MSEEKIMNAVINSCDALDITRVHERENGAWRTTTIFNDDAALLRVIRIAIDAYRIETKCDPEKEGMML